MSRVACGYLRPAFDSVGNDHRHHGIDLGTSFVVGDSPEDMDAPAALGCPGVLVRTGWAVTLESGPRARHVADDVLGAARWIVESLRLAPPVRS